jgi:2,4-dienoyl-CoA reductase (NADPH2)
MTASKSWAAKDIWSTSFWHLAPTSALIRGVARRRTVAVSRPRSCAAPAWRSAPNSSSATACRWPTTSKMVIDHPKVLTYAEAITGAKPVGKTVAVVGAGGIGFDVSELLLTDQSPTHERQGLKAWKAEWGVADPPESFQAQGARGALTTPLPAPPAREVYLLQRTKGPQGKRLGKTTGWVHRASLKAKGVHQLCEVNYERITDDGLQISFDPARQRPQVLAVDSVVVCAGQEPVRDLADELRRAGVDPHIIGGAALAAELDAKRAIQQGTALAARL